MVCQICSNTGHSAKECRQRQQNSRLYGQIPYDRQPAEANRNHKRKIKIIMKDVPKIYKMTAEDKEEEQYEYDSENSQNLNWNNHVSGPQTSQVRTWLDDQLSNGQSLKYYQRQPIRGGGTFQRWRTTKAQQHADKKSRTSTDLHRRLQKGQQSATCTKNRPMGWPRKTSAYIERADLMKTDTPTLHRRFKMTAHGRTSQTSVHIRSRTFIAKKTWYLLMYC